MKPSPETRHLIARYLPERLIDLFLRGLDQFNLGEYFECHETLEAVWQEQTGSEREITQGIIQIAVGLYHLEKQNEVGSLKLLERGATRLEKFEDDNVGLTVYALAQSVRLLLDQIRDQNLAVSERKRNLKIAFV